MRRVLAVSPCAVVVAATVLAACGQAPPDPTATDLDLSAYPPCASQPAPPTLPEVPGLVLPPSATPFSSHSLGPLTQVEGVVPMTPLQVRAFYEDHPALDVITAEDERIETEVLVGDGTHRMFVKAQIVCAGGSNLVVTVGDEAQAGALPTPAGGSPQGG